MASKGEPDRGSSLTAQSGVPDLRGSAAPQQPPEPTVEMPSWIFALAIAYLIVLIAMFVAYATSPTLRRSLPTRFGPLPSGVAWFGAVGAVIASLKGIFGYNRTWKMSFNYWHYSRPLIGAVTGSIGALIYWVLLRLGNSGSVTVDRTTFFVAAFVFGFADKAFTEMLQSVTEVLIKPGNRTSSTS
jgi:hypothetical protein